MSFLNLIWTFLEFFDKLILPPPTQGDSRVKPNFQNLSDVDIGVSNFAVPSFVEILESMGVKKVGDLAKFVTLKEAVFKTSTHRALKRLGCRHLAHVADLERRDLRRIQDAEQVWAEINAVLIRVGLRTVDDPKVMV